MRIEADFSSLKQTNLREHLVRFVLGGAVTVAAGLIARRWGPVIGGLFLAFPAIFPAGATLIEQHEVKRKREIGRDGRRRGRLAAALVYTRGSHDINLFVWPAKPEPASHGSKDGYNFERWSANGMTFWAVSNVNAADLARSAA